MPAPEVARLTKLRGTGSDVLRGFGIGLRGLSALGFFVALLGAVQARAKSLALLRALSDGCHRRCQAAQDHGSGPYGGSQTSMKTMLDASSIVAEADGGSAWVTTLLNVCAWLTGLFPVAAQDEVFGANPDAKVSGVLAPTATSRKVEGGLIVSGKWFWNSGSWMADWATLGIPITNEVGETIDQGLVLIPNSDMRIEDTWFVAGMCSTASNCLIAEEVFVPEHRILSDRYKSETCNIMKFGPNFRHSFLLLNFDSRPH